MAFAVLYGKNDRRENIITEKNGEISMTKMYLAVVLSGVLLVVPPNVYGQQRIPWDTVINQGASRFRVLQEFNSEAVLDRETLLVWERAPAALHENYTGAHERCNNAVIGDRKGWRLPTVQELTSLVDPTGPTNPPLSDGHPFIDVLPDYYWSATSSSATGANPTDQYAWSVLMTNGFANFGQHKTLHPALAWCVRFRQGTDVQ